MFLNKLREYKSQVDNRIIENKSRRTPSLKRSSWDEEVALLREEALGAFEKIDRRNKKLLTLKQFYDCCTQELGLDWSRVKIRRVFYSFSLNERDCLPKNQFEQYFPLLLVEELVFIVKKTCKAYYDQNDLSKSITLEKGEPVLVKAIDGSFAKLSQGLWVDCNNLKQRDRWADMAKPINAAVSTQRRDSSPCVDVVHSPVSNSSSSYDFRPKISFDEVLKVLSPRSRNFVEPIPENPPAEPKSRSTGSLTNIFPRRAVQFSFTGTVDSMDTDDIIHRERPGRNVQYSFTSTLDSEDLSEVLTDLPGLPSASPERPQHRTSSSFSPTPSRRVHSETFLHPEKRSAARSMGTLPSFSSAEFAEVPDSNLFGSQPSCATLTSSVVNEAYVPGAATGRGPGRSRHFGQQPSCATLTSSILDEGYLQPHHKPENSFATFRSSLMSSRLAPPVQDSAEPEPRNPPRLLANSRPIVSFPPYLCLPDADFVRDFDKPCEDPIIRKEKNAYETITIPVNLKQLQKRFVHKNPLPNEKLQNPLLSPTRSPVAIKRTTMAKNPISRTHDAPKRTQFGLDVRKRPMPLGRRPQLTLNSEVKRSSGSSSPLTPSFLRPTQPLGSTPTFVASPVLREAGQPSEFVRAKEPKTSPLASPSWYSATEVQRKKSSVSSEYPSRLNSLISESSEALKNCINFRHKHGLDKLQEESEDYSHSMDWRQSEDEDISSTVWESEYDGVPRSPIFEVPAIPPSITSPLSNPSSTPVKRFAAFPKRKVGGETRYSLGVLKRGPSDPVLDDDFEEMGKAFTRVIDDLLKV